MSLTKIRVPSTANLGPYEDKIMGRGQLTVLFALEFHNSPTRWALFETMPEPDKGGCLFAIVLCFCFGLLALIACAAIYLLK